MYTETLYGKFHRNIKWPTSYENTTLADMFPLPSRYEVAINGLPKTVKLKPSDAVIKSDSDRVD